MAFKDFVREFVSRQKLIGTDVQGWFGNGLQELQSVMRPGFEHQVAMGTNATLGTVTSGEVTIERTQEEREQVQEQQPQRGHEPEYE